MFLIKLVDTKKEFVINILSVIEEGSNNGLDAEYAFVGYGRTERVLCGVLNFCSIDDGCVLVGLKM